MEHPYKYFQDLNKLKYSHIKAYFEAKNTEIPKNILNILEKEKSISYFRFSSKLIRRANY